MNRLIQGRGTQNQLLAHTCQLKTLPYFDEIMMHLNTYFHGRYILWTVNTVVFTLCGTGSFENIVVKQFRFNGNLSATRQQYVWVDTVEFLYAMRKKK